MKRIELTSAYILHSRPYRETSVLLEVFTHKHGRFSVIAKGVRRHKNPARAVLQPFVPLLIACAGRSELLNLSSYEAEKPSHALQGQRLISGLYINELLIRLLHRFEAHESLFEKYRDTLSALEQSDIQAEQVTLRLFEKALLKEIGYELPLTFEAETQQKIKSECFYNFDPEQGPMQVPMEVLPSIVPGMATSTTSSTMPSISNLGKFKTYYSGKSLLALAADNLTDPEVLKDCKRLMRQALSVLLGDKPLETRRLL